MYENEVFISVDVEASGPIPGEYSMLSIGACEVGQIENNFYIELRPINDNFLIEALQVCGFSIKELKVRGTEPSEAMRRFHDWINKISNGRKPIFVAFHLGFDWSMIQYYFFKYLGENPFGTNGIDAESVWFGRNKMEWNKISKSRIKEFFNITIDHTHHALEDAIEQAIVFQAILNYKDE